MNRLKYITKIKANLSVYTKVKSSNILEGTYHSIYKGKSLNFEDLREYVVGDNIKDIDWKASSRANKILVKQFVAEKKHNVLFVLDTGKKMLADTIGMEPKNEVALMAVGTISYLINKNGDSISAIYNGKNGIKYFPFKTGLYNIENVLSSYEKNISTESDLNQLLDYVIKYIRRKMIIFVVTDLKGMNNISNSILKKLSLIHDVMFINVSDAIMTGYQSYDMDINSYIPDYILEDKNISKIELDIKSKLYKKIKAKFRKHKIVVSTFNKQKDIITDVYKLLERRKNAH